MAGSSLLVLLDDIASALDDIALLTKVAAKKTTGVLGDDLALNADQVAGVHADRELPVVWAVAKGSARNKLILVPVAIGISAILPWAVMSLLLMGGAYLGYEGFEKIVHKALRKKLVRHDPETTGQAQMDPAISPLELEKIRIKGAIRTDLVLSAEIIVIALGTVKDSTWTVQLAVVSTIAALMTVGVYGFVAMVVKLDDAGLYLTRRNSRTRIGKLRFRLGSGLLALAPLLMKFLSFVGTLAMFMVGGGIIVHSVPWLNNLVRLLEEHASSWHSAGKLLEPAVAMVANTILGILIGSITFAAVRFATFIFRLLRPKKRSAA
jgi:hypothetical protein